MKKMPLIYHYRQGVSYYKPTYRQLFWYFIFALDVVVFYLLITNQIDGVLIPRM